MATKRPRVLGPNDLLELRRPLREKPAPLIYFTDREFARLIKGAVELSRRPRGPSVLTFEPWPSGGMVQGECESPPGQICFGRWTPAGPGQGGGVYFECICTPTVDRSPQIRCQAYLDTAGTLQCTGSCEGADQCRLGFWRNRVTHEVVLACRCMLGVIIGRARRSARR